MEGDFCFLGWHFGQNWALAASSAERNQLGGGKRVWVLG